MIPVFADYLPAEYVHPDDLKPGDLVPVGDTVVAVLETCPVFNSQFRPVRFSDDPHYARDLDRDYDVLTYRWCHHGTRDMLGRDLTQLAYLAGAAA